jgi:hypothetical protein
LYSLASNRSKKYIQGLIRKDLQQMDGFGFWKRERLLDDGQRVWVKMTDDEIDAYLCQTFGLKTPRGGPRYIPLEESGKPVIKVRDIRGVQNEESFESWTSKTLDQQKKREAFSRFRYSSKTS